MTRFRLYSIAALALLASGCGRSGPELADVTGTITVDGKPAPGLGVTFLPTNGKGSPSYGGTTPEGKYVLQFTRDKSGALLGDYDVVLEPAGKLTKSEVADLKAQGLPVPPAPPSVPGKYKKPGALKVTVASGSNTLNFQLTSK